MSFASFIDKIGEKYVTNPWWVLLPVGLFMVTAVAIVCVFAQRMATPPKESTTTYSVTVRHGESITTYVGCERPSGRDVLSFTAGDNTRVIVFNGTIEVREEVPTVVEKP